MFNHQLKNNEKGFPVPHLGMSHIENERERERLLLEVT